MHELSLARALLDIVVRHAEGRRVARVDLEVGRLRQVVPSALTFAFDLVSQGTVAEGAELAIEHVPVRARCDACAEEVSIEALPLACPRCGSGALEIVSGEELRVRSLDMAEA